MSPVIQAPPRQAPVLVRTNGRIPPPPPQTGGDDGRDQNPSPCRPLFDNAVLATIFVIGGEVMFFAGLIFSFWIVRLAAPVWPPPLQPRLPIGVTGVNTLVLLGSSLMMVRAGRALVAGDRSAFVRRLCGSAGLGATFLLVQGYEWIRLIEFGLTASSGAYGATFYTLIGAHAAHVAAALLWLAVTTVLAARGKFRGSRPAAVRACALYWHFVVALWPILYVSVYLL